MVRKVRSRVLPSRRLRLSAITGLLLAVMLAGNRLFIDPNEASPALDGRQARNVLAGEGDVLRTITAVRGSGHACASTDVSGHNNGGSIGIAFDGTNLFLSCLSDGYIDEVSPVDGHFVEAHAIVGAGGSLGALSWDKTRGLLWVCYDPGAPKLWRAVGTIDLTTDTITPRFTADVGDRPGCLDGLAYDASDDTIWASGDVSQTTEHYSVTGSLIASYPNTSRLGGSGNGGIAVAGPKLYLDNDGLGQIYRVEKDFSSSTLIVNLGAGPPMHLFEDLECDSKTFQDIDKDALWLQNSDSNVLTAFEVPKGGCPYGGGGLPTVNTLASFAVRRHGGRIMVSWWTASEAEIAAFNVWRDGRKLNPRPLPARMTGTVRGASYRYLDRTARSGPSREYRLQVIDLAGRARWAGRTSR